MHVSVDFDQPQHQPVQVHEHVSLNGKSERLLFTFAEPEPFSEHVTVQEPIAVRLSITLAEHEQKREPVAVSQLVHEVDEQEPVSFG